MQPSVIELDQSDEFDRLVAQAAKCATAPGATATDRALLDLALIMKAELDRPRLYPHPGSEEWFARLPWWRRIWWRLVSIGLPKDRP
jgi:hypothetical protein